MLSSNITESTYFKAIATENQLTLIPDLKAIKEDFGEFLTDETDFDEMELESQILEDLMCNGWDYVQPEEIGALTSAPIISPDVTRDDEGEFISVDVVYAYMDYQVDSWVQRLCDGHSVVWQKG